LILAQAEAIMPTKFISSWHREGLYWGGSMWWGVSLIILGVLSGALVLAGVAVNLAIAWLIVLAGLAQLVVAHHTRRVYSSNWRIIVGFGYVVFGLYLIAYPVQGLVSLTMVLTPLVLLEGIFEILVFLRLRTIEGSSWVLVKGIVTLILGLMIYLKWPSTAAWAIDVLVSVSLVTSGVTLLMLSLAVRNAMAAVLGGNNQDDSSAKEYWKIHSY
jgi:uncharacterized membrane protein HdeD (DUF308 family)